MKRLALRGAALCLVSIPQLAGADVLEIGTNGAISVRASDVGTVPSPDGISSTEDEDTPAFPAAALTTLDPPFAPASFQAPLVRAAQTARLSPTLLAALVWQESRWHQDAISPKGARGLTQLMPGTARALAVDATDATANLAGGARYLRRMLDLFDGNVERALAAYNAGPGRVLREAAGLPPIAETRAYVSAIMDRLDVAGVSVPGGMKP